MQKTPKFWQALETLPVLSQIRADWRDRIGDEFDLLTRYLRPCRDLATVYPCPSPGGENCSRQIVIRSSGEIVAVCGNSPRECETVTLKREDIIIYELDIPYLCLDLRVCFDLRGGKTQATAFVRTFFIGDYRPYAGFSYPCYLALQSTDRDMAGSIDHLLSVNNRPILLLAPGDSRLGENSRRQLANRKSTLLPLSEACCVSDEGSILLIRPREELLSDWLATLIPQNEDPYPMAFFRTPPDAKWPEVSIIFKDSHVVRVEVRGVKGTFHFNQMGMVNSKNGEPTEQWALLQHFADGDGELGRNSSHYDRKNQKRREALSKNLRDFFRIESDPIIYRSDIGGWRTLFAVGHE